MQLSQQFQRTAQTVSNLSDLNIVLLQHFEGQENQALKSYSLLALMDSILFYKASQTFFNKLFLSLETLMNTILDSQISFPDMFQWTGLIEEVITVLQRLFGNFNNINQKRDQVRAELVLQVNGKKLDYQEKNFIIQNEKLAKWQLFETNTFIKKHFNTMKHDPEKLQMDINLLEEQECRMLSMILKCESDQKLLAIDIGAQHRQLQMCVNEIYKIIHKLHLELREDRLYEFIQDQKIDEWRAVAPQCISKGQEVLRMFGTLLGTSERLSDRVKTEYYPEWKEQIEKSQKQLLNELQSIMLFSRKDFPQESGAVLSMLDKAYKK